MIEEMGAEFVGAIAGAGLQWGLDQMIEEIRKQRFIAKRLLPLQWGLDQMIEEIVSRPA